MAYALGGVALAISGVTVFGSPEGVQTSIAFSNLALALFVVGFVVERRGR